MRPAALHARSRTSTKHPWLWAALRCGPLEGAFRLQMWPSRRSAMCTVHTGSAALRLMHCLQIKARLDDYCRKHRGEFDTNGTSVTYRQESHWQHNPGRSRAPQGAPRYAHLRFGVVGVSSRAQRAGQPAGQPASHRASQAAWSTIAGPSSTHAPRACARCARRGACGQPSVLLAQRSASPRCCPTALTHAAPCLVVPIQLQGHYESDGGADEGRVAVQVGTGLLRAAADINY